MLKENKAHLFEFLKILIKDEVDKALALSSKRRKEFKKQFSLKEEQSLQNLDPTNTPTLPSDPSLGISEPQENDPGDEKPSDPIEAIKKVATDLAEKTEDVSLILKAVKAQLQDSFDQIKDPKEVVKALQDTDNSVLQDVAKRLQQFITV